MTQSNVALLSGADIAYISRPPILGEPAPGRIESDILLTTAATAGSRRSTANGHCTFYFSTSTGICRPMIVTTGTRALRTPWRITVVRFASPFARAVRM